MCMTRQQAIPITESSRAPNGKMFLKIGYAPFAALAKTSLKRNNNL